MDYVNGGVLDYEDDPIITKKRLIALCKQDPGLVEFYPTSHDGPQYKGRVSRLPADVTLVVCGPDPYTERKWFANITRDPLRDHVRVT